MLYKTIFNSLQRRYLYSSHISQCCKVSSYTPEYQLGIEQQWKGLVSQSLQSIKLTDNQKFLGGNGEKKYILSMFPYPSGKLHMGHVRVYTISDTFAKFFHMNGYSVIHPMGWDGFGLPAENAAIERGEDPSKWTWANIQHMKSQLENMGCSFDWDREIATCDPSYYKWTQYIFIKMFKRELAYQKDSYVHWDPIDQTVLADEQVDEDGLSWRSGAKVEKKKLKQWFIRTTRFAEALYKDLDDPCLTNWRDISQAQKHWIGECNGYTVELELLDEDNSLKCTMPIWVPDLKSLQQALFVSVKSDHELAHETSKTSSQALKYRIREPLSNRILPVIVHDDLPYAEGQEAYVGLSYDSIAVDELSTFGLHPQQVSAEVLSEKDALSELKSLKYIVFKSSSKLKDWLISRQRYWGTPIPIIHCPSCGPLSVPEDQLPVELPKNESLTKGRISLEHHTDWMTTTCPSCNGPSTRETDTMDTFVDSSWYYLRYLDPKNEKNLIDKAIARNHMPVDLYIGGKEHAIMHLYYARFMHKFLVSEGIAFHKEPFKELLVQGVVRSQTYSVKSSGKYLPLEEVDINVEPPVERSTGEVVRVESDKMSKSKHNGVDPQTLMDTHGVDVTRLVMLSEYGPQSSRLWSDDAIPRASNILFKLSNTVNQFVDERTSGTTTETQNLSKHKQSLFEIRNKTICEVTFNNKEVGQLHTSIKAIQTLLGKLRGAPKEMLRDVEYEKTLRALLQMFYPFCPHISAESWRLINTVSSKGYEGHVYEQPWPNCDPDFKKSLEIKFNSEKLDHIFMSQHDYQKLNLEAAISRSKILCDNIYEKKILFSALRHSQLSHKAILTVNTLTEREILAEKKMKKKVRSDSKA